MLTRNNIERPISFDAGLKQGLRSADVAMNDQPERSSEQDGMPPIAPSPRFNFSCRSCGSVLEALIAQSGTPGRCPTCAAVFNVPRVHPRTGLALGAGDSGETKHDPTPVHAYAAAGDKAPEIVHVDGADLAIVCPRCAVTSDIERNYCAACGFPFTMEGANRAAQSTADGYAVASFVVGLISLPVCICAGAYGGIGALVAGILGWTSLTRVRPIGSARRGRAWAIAGLSLAVVGLVVVLVEMVA